MPANIDADQPCVNALSTFKNKALGPVGGQKGRKEKKHEQNFL
jgi:hypothetical protein